MTSVAPKQLPITPRPQPEEILSSWLLRVAAANGVSLRELLTGLESQYPRAVHVANPIDWAVPHITLKALAQFCRVPVKALQELDLQRRAPHLDPRLLLRFAFPGAPLWWSRLHSLRARYAYCAVCLKVQSIPHVRWEWCFAALKRCSIHRVELCDGCISCGEVDPLHFAAPDELVSARCWSCGALLAVDADAGAAPREFEDAVDDSYRAALRGIAPEAELLGTASSQEFRRFIHDMLELLGACLNQPPAYPTKGRISRLDLLSIIGGLIRTAAPSPNAKQSRARHSRALVLWGTLLKLLNPREGEELLRGSVRWPPAIRRRLASAMLRRRRKRWPYESFTASPICLVFKCHTVAVVYELRGRKSLQPHAV